ncbi:MAG TPA: HD domain-containing phosphohydrolase [Chloroflexota bacterium]|nr:HD domain-containing phosphohydrolase [Chloroflexota bacterium]
MSPGDRPAADVLVVDDNDANRLLLRTYLKAQGYTVREAADGETALGLMGEQMPDLLLLDVMMPGLSGYDVCRQLRDMPDGALVPVIMATALHDSADKAQAADAGADDFISKPLDKLEVLTRVRSLLRIKRLTDELDGAETTILALARALEARDPYTRGHSQRVGEYGARLACFAGLSSEEQDSMRIAGLLHDVGKIGVCEGTLLHPGPLSPQQKSEMMRHPVVGAEICKPLKSLKGNVPAIRHHHERWTGGGYPDNLDHCHIPLGARITSICDSWDAMTSDRVYRQRLPNEEALTIMGEGMGTQWDPDLTKLFLGHYREITAV